MCLHPEDDGPIKCVSLTGPRREGCKEQAFRLVRTERSKGENENETKTEKCNGVEKKIKDRTVLLLGRHPSPDCSVVAKASSFALLTTDADRCSEAGSAPADGDDDGGRLCLLMGEIAFGAQSAKQSQTLVQKGQDGMKDNLIAILRRKSRRRNQSRRQRDTLPLDFPAQPQPTKEPGQ